MDNRAAQMSGPGPTSRAASRRSTVEVKTAEVWELFSQNILSRLYDPNTLPAVIPPC